MLPMKKLKSGRAAGIPSAFVSNSTARNKQTSVNLRIIDNLQQHEFGQTQDFKKMAEDHKSSRDQDL